MRMPSCGSAAYLCIDHRVSMAGVPNPRVLLSSMKLHNSVHENVTINFRALLTPRRFIVKNNLSHAVNLLKHLRSQSNESTLVLCHCNIECCNLRADFHEYVF